MNPSISPLEVVAALIRRGDAVLLGCRPEGKRCAGQWEFMGGKVEPGETKSQAIAREMREETGIDMDVDGELLDVVHEYPGLTVHLTLMEGHLSPTSPEPAAKEHQAIRWVPWNELDTLPLCPADGELVQRINSPTAKPVGMR